MAKKVERRLAAVLSADGVGYGRLIAADEEGTLARLRALREQLIDAKFSEHRGRIVFRIGINLGDVVIDGDDIHGDGVNISARLEQLCEPGGIMLSGTAYDHVRDRLGLGYEDIGEQTVKNIPRPVRAYRVVLDPSAAGETAAAKTTKDGISRHRR